LYTVILIHWRVLGNFYYLTTQVILHLMMMMMMIIIIIIMNRRRGCRYRLWSWQVSRRTWVRLASFLDVIWTGTQGQLIRSVNYSTTIVSLSVRKVLWKGLFCYYEKLFNRVHVCFKKLGKCKPTTCLCRLRGKTEV